MVMERCVQTVVGTYEEVKAIENEFDSLEAKMGNVPNKRRYWASYGSLPFGTMIWEREWDNLAAIQAYNEKIMQSPDWTPTFDKAGKIFSNVRFELYQDF